jgi:hypothetical protein
VSRLASVRGRAPVVVVSTRTKKAKPPRPPCLLHQYNCKDKQSDKWKPYCSSHGRRIKGWKGKPAWKREARKTDLARWGAFLPPVIPVLMDKGKH